MMAEKKYKWDNPQEWLIEYAGKLDANKLFQEFTVLVQQMDSDSIQDLYQSEMSADGYFDAEPTSKPVPALYEMEPIGEGGHLD